MGIFALLFDVFAFFVENGHLFLERHYRYSMSYTLEIYFSWIF